MAIEQLMQAVLTATPAMRRRIEAAIRGDEHERRKAQGEEDRRLVTISAAARLLALGRNTVYRLIETGRLDTVELNGCKRVTMKSIKEFTDGNRPANEKTAELVAASKARYANSPAARNIDTAEVRDEQE